MATADYHSHPYVRQLNDWHLELAMLRDLIDHILREVDDDCPDWVGSASHIALERFSYLVETCPFPQQEFLQV